MTLYTHFTVEGEHTFTEELHDYSHNIVFFCEICGREWARVEFAPTRKWRSILSHCVTCDSRWGGSLFDLPDRVFHKTLSRSILMREFNLELSRHESR